MLKNNPFTIPFTNRRYLDAVEDHIVLFDGATGTELAKYPVSTEDFGGIRTEGLMEMLLFSRPEIVQRAHAAYFSAGAEVVETNSFRANRLTLDEFGVGERTEEINYTAASLARQVAEQFTKDTGIPRFVAGSMGPTGKLPSLADPELSDISFDDLVAIFAEQARGLIRGGVDLLLLETQQDLLALKAAIHGIWRTFRELAVRIPIQAQVTLDVSGHMLTGPDIEAALVALAALPVDIIGMNCSTGPDEMRESVQRLLALTNRPVSILPNAGMPDNVEGRAVYNMEPGAFADSMAEFARWGVRVVGGCCGTGPAHIRALAERLDGMEVEDSSSKFALQPLPYLASNMQATALHQLPRPLIVGERINTQGSRKARSLVLEERYEALLELAEDQVNYGAHILDVCVALTERDDEIETMQRVVKLLSLNVPAPLVIDTTDLDVMRAALQLFPGSAVINSVNLERGEAHALQVLELARDYGAVLIALTIDEEGMAKTTARKLDVARRLYDLAVNKVGLPPHALIFDPLTFTLATGDAETANAGVETLNAIEQIKTRLPGVLTNLGVSNISYGLKPPARRVLNSVFLYCAVESGLDVAIVNPAQITPYADISSVERDLARNLIFNRHSEALVEYIAHFEGITEKAEDVPVETLSPAERLFNAVLHRHREGVEALVETCAAQQAPLTVLNEILLPAMQEVGVRFGAGELILPFVLKSAEVMKAAVKCLEPHLERANAGNGASISKGTVVLATVFGDVHDIGKNLVKTILSNNNYTVHDLGKQVPVKVIVDKAVAVNADAIGLSALLVATSQQMEQVVKELHRRNLSIPVLIGGAAINTRFAERITLLEDGTPYSGGVYYCPDAFEALSVLAHRVSPAGVSSATSAPNNPVKLQTSQPVCTTCNSGVVILGSRIPHPPFWGVKVVTGISLDDIYPLLDHKSLFRVGWGAKGATGEAWTNLRTEFEARLATMWPPAVEYLHPQAVYGYFPAQAAGNDLVIYDPAAPDTRREVGRFTFPRQPDGKRLCLADYFLPVDSSPMDVVALQIVTVGAGATTRFAALERQDVYSEAYFVHGLASAATEALATWVHSRIREELALPPGQGQRYSWGYPACPDLSGHQELFRLLPAAETLSMSLSPAAQLIPEHSTAALVVHHPDARYFTVKI